MSKPTTLDAQLGAYAYTIPGDWADIATEEHAVAYTTAMHASMAALVDPAPEGLDIDAVVHESIRRSADGAREAARRAWICLLYTSPSPRD